MMTFLTIVHVATIVLLVIAVLLQAGKGAEISATFGGSSQTVFGSSGGQNFFQKLTYGLAAVFMVTSLVLTILPGKTKKSVFEGFTPPPSSTAPIEKVPAEKAPMGGDAPAAQKVDAAKAEAVKAEKKAKAAEKKAAEAPKEAAPAAH
ncbi:MAG: preprotein translocase subunit SecG [Bdellovibrionales bacterium]|nr:preprotein translocase subunit SecG [Bdellovibrionales bacterium]